MIKLMITLTVMACLLGCENTEGQYRHDTKHHEESKKNDAGKT